jgi:four helix bundle protein
VNRGYSNFCGKNRSGKQFIIGHLSFLIYHLPLARVVLTFHKGDILTMSKQPEDPQTIATRLEERLINFAVRIIHLSNSLPRTPAGRHVAGQILRSGTSPAPNYGEARGAESRADFIHKERVVFKELNETSIWLRIIERSRLLSTAELKEIMEENRELCKIFAASLRTARTR